MSNHSSQFPLSPEKSSGCNPREGAHLPFRAAQEVRKERIENEYPLLCRVGASLDSVDKRTLCIDKVLHKVLEMRLASLAIF